MWAVGIIDRATKFAVVDILSNGNDRSANVLLPCIQEKVSTNPLNPTRVYTDGWAAYNNLQNLDFDHHVVLHVN